MAKRFHNQGEYAGYDARRKEESRDFGMISEDHGSIANMPQNVIMREYPRPGDYLPEGLDDTLRGVNEQIGADNAKRRAHNKPKKV